MRARHVIISSMWVWTERLPGGRLLRWLCVVTALLAALVAGIVIFDQRANADSYDPEELGSWSSQRLSSAERARGPSPLGHAFGVRRAP